MKELDALREECMACRRCKVGGVMVEGKFLSNVFSSMACDAEVMVVGQNPGREEVEYGFPFVGRSGRFFDAAVQECLGLARSDLYVSNCAKCYTPGNRKPFQDEVENCRHFLDKEIALLKPKLVLALGSSAFTQLTGVAGIMKHHGEKVFSPRYRVFVVPLLHPSPLNMNDPAKRKEFYEDLRRVKGMLSE